MEATTAPGVSLGSAEEPYHPDMTHSYRLTEGRLIRYPLTRVESEVSQKVNPRGHGHRRLIPEPALVESHSSL